MNSTKKSGYALSFVLTAVLFAVCTLGGMFYAYRLGGGQIDKPGEILRLSLSDSGGFGAVLVRGVRADFRYTAAVLICTLCAASSYIPGLMVLFKGFCTGLCVGTAARVLERAAAFKVSAALFLSCAFTVPIYILMFMLCVHRAKRYLHTNAPRGERLKDYFRFAASVMLMFAFLCAADCILALFALMM